MSMRVRCLIVAWGLVLSAVAGATAQDVVPGAPVPVPEPRDIFPPPGKLVVVEVTIIELADRVDRAGREPMDKLLARIEQLESDGKLRAQSRFKLTTVEHDEAKAQFSEMKHVVSSRTSSPTMSRGTPAPGGSGRATPSGFNTVSYVQQNFGTLVTARTRVETSGTILVQFNLERSYPVEETEPADGTAPAPAGYQTMTCKSTLRVRDGGTVLADSRAVTSGQQASQTLILVSAHVADDE